MSLKTKYEQTLKGKKILNKVELVKTASESSQLACILGNGIADAADKGGETTIIRAICVIRG